MDGRAAEEIQGLLRQIEQLTVEIENSRSLMPAGWAKDPEVARRCTLVRQHCQRISILVGTGSGGTVSGTGRG